VDKDFILTRGYKADISFGCPKCNAKATDIVDVPEPDWTADRASDMTAEDDLVVECKECGEGFSGHVFNSGGHCDISLDEFPHVVVDAGHAYYDGPPHDEDWSDFDTPPQPYSVFMDSFRETSSLLSERGGDGTSLVNRMVFGQQLSALEAYLSDTLINGVLKDKAVMAKLLENDKDLEKKKFTLAQVDADPTLVTKTVQVHLRGVLYHNIPKVSALYRIAFDINLFELLGEENKARLMQAVLYRHDCVHRNGHDTEGRKLDVFTREYVRDIAHVIGQLVDEIQNERASNMLKDIPWNVPRTVF
jgi:hypothetical protein